MRYEYLRHDFSTTDPVEQMNLMNQLGAKGWELAWIHTSVNSPSATLFFKRCVMSDGKSEKKAPKGKMDYEGEADHGSLMAEQMEKYRGQ